MSTQVFAVNRRTALGIGSGLAAAVSLTGCGFLNTKPESKTGAAAAGSGGKKGKESPDLAAQVKAGKLPAVEKRLPENPAVVEAVEKVGQYGGTWRSAMITQEDAQWLTISIGYDPIVRWKRQWSDSPGTDEIMPNLASEFAVKDGGRVFEFKLRKGLRWSDGQPMTLEDMRFAFEDVNTYSGLNPDGVYSLWLDAETQKPAQFKQIDDLTVQFVFTNPKPGFLNEIAVGQAAMFLPKHYLKQFHAKYNKNISALVKKQHLNDWGQLWENVTQAWTSTAVPTMNAWMTTTALGDGSAVTATRNPYYWKTDTEGSQLPYIDAIHCDVLQDVQVELLKVTNGEYDMQMRNFSTVGNKPVVAEGEQKGDYRLFDISPAGPSALCFAFNQTLKDKAKAELFGNLDFRIGMSYAINRQKIIDSVYAGQGKPWQCAPLPGSPVYSEKMGTQYTKYSPELANASLDKAGLTKRDSQGYRMWKGKRVTVAMLVDSAMPDEVDAMALIKADWNKVGVQMTVQNVAETLYWQRVQANLAEASAWTGGDFEIRATQGSNHYYLPTNPRGSSRWGSTWANWYVSGGKEGSPPPAPYRKGLELFDQMRATYDAAAATKLGREIIAIVTEQFPYIGICTPADSYGIAKNKFRNVMKKYPGSGGYGAPGPNNPEHFFFES